MVPRRKSGGFGVWGQQLGGVSPAVSGDSAAARGLSPAVPRARSAVFWGARGGKEFN